MHPNLILRLMSEFAFFVSSNSAQFLFENACLKSIQSQVLRSLIPWVFKTPLQRTQSSGYQPPRVWNRRKSYPWMGCHEHRIKGQICRNEELGHGHAQCSASIHSYERQYADGEEQNQPKNYSWEETTKNGDDGEFWFLANTRNAETGRG